jgi:hypothetical protein
MPRYFEAANFWLFWAIAAWVGQAPVRDNGRYCTFFGIGREFDTVGLPMFGYSLIIVVPMLLSVACFALWVMSAKKHDPHT